MGMECGPNPLVAYIKDVFFLIPHKNTFASLDCLQEFLGGIEMRGRLVL